MDALQLKRGLNHFKCVIKQTWVRDPVRVINHPSTRAALKNISREALSLHLKQNQICPLTNRTDIDWPSMAVLCSLREMILFALSALQHIERKLIVIESTCEKLYIQKILQGALDTLPAAFRAKMEQLLENLATDRPLPRYLNLHQIELDNLASFGVPMDLPLQKCYLYENYVLEGRALSKLTPPLLIPGPTPALNLSSSELSKPKSLSFSVKAQSLTHHTTESRTHQKVHEAQPRKSLKRRNGEILSHQKQQETACHDQNVSKRPRLEVSQAH